MKSYGQINYEAYCNHRHWKTFAEELLPQWSELPARMKDAWEAGAETTVNEFLSRQPDDEETADSAAHRVREGNE